MSNDFGIRLQQLRSEKGWSQADLARSSGLNRAVISKIESGASEPMPETLKSLASAFKMPIEQMYRLAGLLPSISREIQKEEELCYLMSLLSEEDQEDFIDLLRLKVERNQQTPDSKSSRKKNPARSALIDK
jgi:transcriptional regulator with XRE-family HTH domain